MAIFSCQSTSIGWIGGRETGGQSTRPELESRRTRETTWGDGTELGAASTDVDDERLGANLSTTRHADEREVGLLLVREHLKRGTGRVLDLGDDPDRIARTTDRLGPEQRDPLRLEGSRSVGVPTQLLRQRRTCCGPKVRL
jgi:hypothetical protein